MAGYNDTKEKIISALMGRPSGEEIQPEDHQDYALNMLDYVRSVELISTSTLIGVADTNTVPVQPNTSRVCYIAGVGQDRTETFNNFIDEGGNPISITTTEMEGVFAIFLWNTEHWSVNYFSTTIISYAENADFYYNYNIKKTYDSISDMNLDSSNPVGTDGRNIKIGDIVTVYNISDSNENGIYSYLGDGWKLQGNMSFGLEQDLGDSPTQAVSQLGISKNSGSMYPLARGYELPDFPNFLVDAAIHNWTGGDKLLFIRYVFHDDPTYQSGMMVHISDADGSNEKMVFYTSTGNDYDGLVFLENKTLEAEGTTYGTIDLLLDFSAIPSGHNANMSNEIYLAKECYNNLGRGVLFYKSKESTDKIPAIEAKTSELYQDCYNYFALNKYFNFGQTYEQISRKDYRLLQSIKAIYVHDELGTLSDKELYPVLHYEYSPGSLYNFYIALVGIIDDTIYASAYVGATLPDIAYDKPQEYELTPKFSGISAKMIIDWGLLKELFSTTAQRIGSKKYVLSNYMYYEGYYKILSDGYKGVDDYAKLSSFNSVMSNIYDAGSTLITGEYVTFPAGSGSYAQKGIGFYTKQMLGGETFNQVRIKGLTGTGEYLYKILLFNGTVNSKDAPNTSQAIIANSSVLKEGAIILDSDKEKEREFFTGYLTAAENDQIIVIVKNSDLSNIPYPELFGYNTGLDPEGSNYQFLSTSDTPFDENAIWGSGGGSYTAQSPKVFLKTPYVVDSDIQQIVENIVPPIVEDLNKSDLEIVIPFSIKLAVGTELNLWNDAISKSFDRGLASPLNYQVRWNCSKGLITDRCFRFKPDISDIGDITCTCYIYGSDFKIIDTKVFVITVVPRSSSVKNIVYFGDSLGSGAAAQLYTKINDLTGDKPIMLGTRGTTYKYEAVGGYRWSDYATAGRIAYRCSVSGVTAISIGAVYTTNSIDFTVREVNITTGVGNILIEAAYGASVTFPTSGILTKVSGAGDSTINYTDQFQEPNNPLWNKDTNQLDIALYKQRLGLQVTDTIDAVSFQFGINDASLADDENTLLTYVTDLYNAFISDNPSCKFLVGMTSSAGNDVNGAGSNYGASMDYLQYLDRVYRLRKLYLKNFQDNPSFPNMELVSSGLAVDRYYGYDLSDRPISDATTETEKYHTNYVHPVSGYKQIADMFFSHFI